MLEAPAIAALTILVLALFVGVEVISKVPPLPATISVGFGKLRASSGITPAATCSKRLETHVKAQTAMQPSNATTNAIPRTCT